MDKNPKNCTTPITLDLGLYLYVVINIYVQYITLIVMIKTICNYYNEINKNDNEIVKSRKI